MYFRRFIILFIILVQTIGLTNAFAESSIEFIHQDKINKYIVQIERRLVSFNRYSVKLKFLNRELKKVSEQIDNEYLKKKLIFEIKKIILKTNNNKRNDISYMREMIYIIDNSYNDPYLIPISKIYNGETSGNIEDKMISIRQYNKDYSDSINGSVLFNPIIADDLFSLNVAYKEQHLGSSIKINSGHRSFEAQKTLFQLYKKQKRSDLASFPGHSEHHLGTAIDFNTNGSNWFENNSINYGFIKSFEKNCESKTGIKEENWHYRWIGTDNAKEYSILRKNDINYCPIDYLRFKTGKYPIEIKNTLLQRYEYKIERNDDLAQCIYVNITEGSYKNIYSVLYERVCDYTFLSR